MLHHLIRGNGLPAVAPLTPHAPRTGRKRHLQLLQRATCLLLVVSDASLDLFHLLPQQLRQ
jgi:hypothetical protein